MVIITSLNQSGKAPRMKWIQLTVPKQFENSYLAALGYLKVQLYFELLLYNAIG